jgi:medium-chain acyl-[acyl-carrier-protein] hydrolase
MALIFSKDYQVPYYESDAQGNMKLPSIYNIALQISGEQSESLGRSDDWLHETYGLTWVVVEYDTHITRLPKIHETIMIETQATAWNKFFCYRDFTFKDKDGQELLVIHTTFCLIDMASRKVGSVIEDIVAPYESEKIRSIIRGHKFTPLENALTRDYHVRFLDIDANQHVNNSKYVDWMIDMLPYDMLVNQHPTRIFMKYVKEVYYGTPVTSRMAIGEGNVTYHEITSDELNAQAEIEWTENI